MNDLLLGIQMLENATALGDLRRVLHTLAVL